MGLQCTAEILWRSQCQADNGLLGLSDAPDHIKLIEIYFPLIDNEHLTEDDDV